MFVCAHVPIHVYMHESRGSCTHKCSCKRLRRNPSIFLCCSPIYSWEAWFPLKQKLVSAKLTGKQVCIKFRSLHLSIWLQVPTQLCYAPLFTWVPGFWSLAHKASVLTHWVISPALRAICIKLFEAQVSNYQKNTLPLYEVNTISGGKAQIH